MPSFVKLSKIEETSFNFAIDITNSLVILTLDIWIVITIVFVAKQRIEPIVAYCCNWQQHFTAIVAMLGFIR